MLVIRKGYGFNRDCFFKKRNIETCLSPDVGSCKEKEIDRFMLEEREGAKEKKMGGFQNTSGESKLWRSIVIC